MERHPTSAQTAMMMHAEQMTKRNLAEADTATLNDAQVARGSTRHHDAQDATGDDHDNDVIEVNDAQKNAQDKRLDS